MGPLDRTVWCFSGIVRRGPSADEKRASFRGRVASPPVVLTGWGPVRAWVPAITLATGDRAGGPHRQGCITSGPVGRGTVRPVGPRGRCPVGPVGQVGRWAGGTVVLWGPGAECPVGRLGQQAGGPMGPGDCRAEWAVGQLSRRAVGTMVPRADWANGTWVLRGDWAGGPVGPRGPGPGGPQVSILAGRYWPVWKPWPWHN